MSEWQPIETAPKDGEAFLIVRAGKEAVPSYNVVYYSEDAPRHCRETHCWHFVDGGEFYHRDWPTHWMPLPEPPNAPSPPSPRGT